MFEGLKVALESLLSGDPAMMIITGFGLVLVSATSPGSKRTRTDVVHWKKIVGTILTVTQDKHLFEPGYLFSYSFYLDGERYTRDSKISIKAPPENQSVLVYVNPRSRYETWTELELHDGKVRFGFLGQLGMIVIALAGVFWLIRR